VFSSLAKERIHQSTRAVRPQNFDHNTVKTGAAFPQRINVTLIIGICNTDFINALFKFSKIQDKAPYNTRILMPLNNVTGKLEFDSFPDLHNLSPNGSKH